MRCDGMGRAMDGSWIVRSFVRSMGPSAVIAPYASQPWWAWARRALRARPPVACGNPNPANYLEATSSSSRPIGSAAWRARSGLPAGSGLIPFGKTPSQRRAPAAAVSARARRRPTPNGTDGTRNRIRTCAPVPNQPPTRAVAPREKTCCGARTPTTATGRNRAGGRPRNGLAAGDLFRCGLPFCLRAHRSTRHARSLGFHSTREARAGRRGWRRRGRSRSGRRDFRAVCAAWPFPRAGLVRRDPVRPDQAGAARAGWNGRIGEIPSDKRRSGNNNCGRASWGARIFSPPPHTKATSIRRSFVGRRGRKARHHRA
jgi:hypothetical protein